MSTIALSNFTPIVLSQSNNASYGLRGVYRVHETPDDRKGDYFFRDFYMVAVCGYMMEMAQRASMQVYNLPANTAALGLHHLQDLKHPITDKFLYPGVYNYKELPKLLRERTTGSLVNSSSVGEIPFTLRNQLLHEAEKNFPHPELCKYVKQLIEKPDTNPDFLKKFVTDHLVKANTYNIGALSEAQGEELIKTIGGWLSNGSVNLENDAARQSALKKVFTDETLQKAANQVLQIAEARQHGVLLEHLEKQLNFKEYLQNRYFQKNPAAKAAINLMQTYADQMMNLEVGNQQALIDAVDEALTRPPVQRKAGFEKAIKSLEKHFYIQDQLITTPKHFNTFHQLTNRLKDLLLKPENVHIPKEQLKPIYDDLDQFFEAFRVADARKARVEKFWEPLQNALKKNIESELTDLIQRAQKQPEAHRLGEFQTGLKKLRLHDYLNNQPSVKTEFEKLIPQIETLVQQATPASEQASKTLFGDIKNTLANISHTELNLWTPLLKGELKILKNISATNITPLKDEILRFLHEGIGSKTTQNMLTTIQKRGTWLPLVGNIALNFVFYGWLATQFDNKILQPYQKKITEQYGTSQAIVNAGYLGSLPALAVITLGFWNKISPQWIQKMGHFTRPAVVGLAGIATYALGWYGFLKLAIKDKKPLPQGTQPSAAAALPGTSTNAPYKAAQLTYNPFGLPATQTFSPFITAPPANQTAAPSA